MDDTNYQQKYFKYKAKYLKSKQIGGNNNIECTKENKNKLNSNVLFKSGMKFEFTFVPTIYDKDTDDTKSIEYNDKNVFNFNEYLKSERWKSDFEYIFGEQRPFFLPHYTPEIYYLINTSTKIKNINSVINVIIMSTIKKYTFEQTKEMAKNEGVLNTTWSEKIDKKMSFCEFYDSTGDAFYKLTQEGELNIKGLGQMSWGPENMMSVNILN